MSDVIEQIADVLRARQRFLVTAHISPEPDALGSMLALRRALLLMGKECQAVNSDGVPPLYQFLPTSEWVVTEPNLGPVDVGIIVDVSGTERVACSREALEACAQRIIIDHHATHHTNGDLNWIDPQASATCELVLRLLKRLPVALDSVIATNLYAGIAIDTGGFRFTNTTPAVLQAAAELVAVGADPSAIAYHLFEERSFAATKLLGAALSNVQTDCGGRLSWSALDRAAFESTQATDGDTENIVNYIRNISGTEVAILFREAEDGRIRISFRSDPTHNVSQLAQEFGGGGHRVAAGCRMRPPLKTAMERVLKRAREVLSGC